MALTDKEKIKLKRSEQRAIRSGARKQGKKLLHQATKFHEDALRAGCKLNQLGASPYKDKHPAYEELVLPLLEQASRLCAVLGFDVLFQVRTPIPGEPNFTACVAGFQNEKSLTPTMKAQIDLIQQRPVIGKEDGFSTAAFDSQPPKTDE
jgi:hypothetical protein